MGFSDNSQLDDRPIPGQQAWTSSSIIILFIMIMIKILISPIYHFDQRNDLDYHFVHHDHDHDHNFDLTNESSEIMISRDSVKDEVKIIILINIIMITITTLISPIRAVRSWSAETVLSMRSRDFVAAAMLSALLDNTKLSAPISL